MKKHSHHILDERINVCCFFCIMPNCTLLYYLIANSKSSDSATIHRHLLFSLKMSYYKLLIISFYVESENNLSVQTLFFPAQCLIFILELD